MKVFNFLNYPISINGINVEPNTYLETIDLELIIDGFDPKRNVRVFNEIYLMKQFETVAIGERCHKEIKFSNKEGYECDYQIGTTFIIPDNIVFSYNFIQVLTILIAIILGIILGLYAVTRSIHTNKADEFI